MTGMRIGLMLGFRASGLPEVSVADQIGLAVAAEATGVDICYTSEAYGHDAVSILAAVAARTSSMRIGSAALQIPGRTAAMTAMTAAGLDAASGGRFELGLGVSGPQVSDGWHGVRFDAPLARTRSYVEAVRMTLARRPLDIHGAGIDVPATPNRYAPLRLSVRPSRPDLPILLAALGDANLRLAGEIADGWLGVWLSPEHLAAPLSQIGTGRAVRAAATGSTADPTSFDVVALVPAALAGPGGADDLTACADRIRGLAALYLGGMGTPEHNFYADQAARLGFADDAASVGELFRAGRLREAAAAVPIDFLDQTCLIGDAAHVGDRLASYARAGVTTLAIAPVGGSTAAQLSILATVSGLARGQS
jgi:F420-dependent oxidoreductase-like protein